MENSIPVDRYIVETASQNKSFTLLTVYKYVYLVLALCDLVLRSTHMTRPEV